LELEVGGTARAFGTVQTSVLIMEKQLSDVKYKMGVAWRLTNLGLKWSRKRGQSGFGFSGERDLNEFFRAESTHGKML